LRVPVTLLSYIEYVQPSREGHRVETRQKSATGSPGWGLSVVLKTPARKKKTLVTETTTNSTTILIVDLSQPTGFMTTTDESPWEVRSTTDDRLIRARFSSKHCKLTILQCYAPMSNYNKQSPSSHTVPSSHTETSTSSHGSLLIVSLSTRSTTY